MKVETIAVALGIVLCNLAHHVSGGCQEACVPNVGNTCSIMSKGTHAFQIESRQDEDEACVNSDMEGKYYWCCTNEKAYDDMMRSKKLQELLGALGGAEINEYPHQIKLTGDKGSGCGGTIYNKEWIITAAHCIKFNGTTHTTVKGGYIIAGKTDLEQAGEEDKYHFKEIIVHENWDQYKIALGHDIALLHLDRELPLEKGKMQPLRVEPENFEPNYGGKAIVMGFGVASEQGVSTYLIEAEVPIHEPTKASRLSFEPLNAPKTQGGFVPLPQQLGVAGDDSGFTVGQGDSGGPLVCNDHNGKPVLCGIASFKDCDLKKVCRRPSYFLRVAPFIEWIKNKTHNAEQPEDLLVDEPMIPMKLKTRDIPGYLVRIQSLTKSCSGALVAANRILTSHACVSAITEGNLSDINLKANMYHYKSGTQLLSRGYQTQSGFKQDISANITKYLHHPLALNDAVVIILPEAVKGAEILKMPPSGYSIKSPAVEYAMNEKVFGVEARRYMPMDRQLCQKKLNVVDKNLKLHRSHLCMRRVYSAEKECERDVGGPLVCEGKYFCGFKTFKGCGMSGFPEIFSNNLDSNLASLLS